MTTTTANLNVRSSGSTAGRVLTLIPKGGEVIVGAKNTDGWYRAFYGGMPGWVSGAYLTDVEEITFLDSAFPELGDLYHIGGNGPNNFDCSGYTLYVIRKWKKRSEPDCTANAQLHKFMDGTWKGKKVALADAQPGDMVFFGYKKTVNGKLELHASHVAFQLDPYYLIGANGGFESTDTDAEASALGAMVRIDPSDYRARHKPPYSPALAIWRFV